MQKTIELISAYQEALEHKRHSVYLKASDTEIIKLKILVSALKVSTIKCEKDKDDYIAIKEISNYVKQVSNDTEEKMLFILACLQMSKAIDIIENLTNPKGGIY